MNNIIIKNIIPKQVYKAWGYFLALEVKDPELKQKWSLEKEFLLKFNLHVLLKIIIEIKGKTRLIRTFATYPNPIIG